MENKNLYKIKKGKTKMVSELLGHHRDDVTRIHLAGDEKPLKIPEISPSIMDI